ncbi:hypothetical protein DFQ30_005404 [Apophysomyces sp. BC1015]|nr:hypothetical protein DFQ30_005404 [Apophysomyces sp. BC1015]
MLAQMDAELREGVAKIAETGKLDAQLEQIFYYAPVPFDAARRPRRLLPRSGYAVGGISHNEVEDAKPEWIEAGANVLLHAMLERAYEQR